MKKVVTLGSLLLLVGIVFAGCAHQPTVVQEPVQPVVEQNPVDSQALAIVYTDPT
ncbi:hypothetical protein HZA41_01925, partial [Candidatus Peregrinibacteria bacterium]|nr:hypothetical protein [Candidatus Peregrinibacteria bacterium]